MSARGTATTEPRRRSRRTVTILQQGAGQEGTTEGQLREEEQKKRSGIFTASRYFWGYFAPAPTLQGAQQPTIVPVGTIAREGECHAVLDAASNLDADPVPWSNSTYEYAEIDPEQPEMLFTRAFTCACEPCRGKDAVSLQYRDCPYLAYTGRSYTGRWRQQTVHAAVAVSRVAAEQREKVEDFSKSTKVGQLCAVFGGFSERGGRPYWLLLCKRQAYQAQKGLRQQEGSTIRKGTWVIDAQWYASTSDDPNRRSYKLLDDPVVHVPVKSLVQEKGLEFERGGARTGLESLLGDECHLRIVRWNFISNVAV